MIFWHDASILLYPVSSPSLTHTHTHTHLVLYVVSCVSCMAVRLTSFAVGGHTSCTVSPPTVEVTCSTVGGHTSCTVSPPTVEVTCSTVGGHTSRTVSGTTGEVDCLGTATGGDTWILNCSGTNDENICRCVLKRLGTLANE